MSGETPTPRTERHYYRLPQTCEMLLAALCAIQDYYKWLEKEKRAVTVNAVIGCQNSDLHQFVACLNSGKHTAEIGAPESLEGFEQAVDFDPEVAYKLSAKTGKHVTQVFGMMLGSDPPKVIPDLSAMKFPEAVEDILVLPFTGSAQVYSFLEVNKPELALYRIDDVEDLSRFVCANTVAGYKMVIGVRSGLTYLAAALGRAVVEIYPTDRHRNWLSKWSNPFYQMIYGDPGQVMPELVYRAVEVVWKRVEQRERAMMVKA